MRIGIYGVPRIQCRTQQKLTTARHFRAACYKRAGNIGKNSSDLRLQFAGL